MTTTTNTKYVIINEDEIKLKKGEVILTSEDAEELLEFGDVFQKFLDKARFSYQIELCKGTFRGKEEQLYRSIDTIDELKSSLKSIEKAFKQHNHKA